MRKVLSTTRAGKGAFYFLLLAIPVVLFFGCTSFKEVNSKSIGYYEKLRTNLKEDGYSDSFFIISTKRSEQWNNVLVRFGGAAKKSQHLKGNAIDIFVMDVNSDGNWDKADVDIVVMELEKIIGDKGGIGTYKNEKFIWNQQMVHLDCRGYKARWDR